MKVSIGSKIVEGPYGGGNLFVKNLKNYLKKNNIDVIDHLDDNDIDIILLINPLKYAETSTYNHHDINYYVTFINPDALVVQRINECDERKNTTTINEQIIKSNKVADFTIYVSSWLQGLYIVKGLDKSNSAVIMSGSDESIFKSSKKKIDNSKFKLVTHHWSSNWNKGFNIYEKIDKLLKNEEWKERLDFTYIGNIPKDFIFKNSKVIKPLDDVKIAKLLKTFNGYITASLNEPSGNHHIEAAQCGLPILYINSGGIPEYCENFGVEFNENNFEEKLKEFIEDYKKYEKNLVNYPYNATKMSKEYLDIFNNLIEKRKEITTKRKKEKKVNVILYLIKSRVEKIVFNLYSKISIKLSNLIKSK
tara:strand:+ start:6413 stop:7501 length:1089 start_codon:yes stop_codon:yes gene_type:complete